MPPSTNGIMRIGLKMMGAPKIAGSEIRKKLGTIDALPNALSCCDFALNAQSATKENVLPVPPMRLMANDMSTGWNSSGCPAA